jgi:hypothetical protein
VKIPGNNPEKRVEDSRLAYIRYPVGTQKGQFI